MAGGRDSNLVKTSVKDTESIQTLHLDEHYVDPRLVDLYDFECGWSVDRDFYLELAGEDAKAVLDLGCGTGLLCDAYAARGHRVTGVDPSAAMLDVARQKPYGSTIDWVCSAVQDYRSEKRFGLIIMTGHAFQVLLGDDDILTAFETIRRHLAPGGMVAFESRNPAEDWSSRWNHEVRIDSPSGPVRVVRTVNEARGDRVKFETCYHLADGEVLVSRSDLRFPTADQIESWLSSCGLRVIALFGDWNRSRFDPAQSDEMIFLAGV